MLWDGGNAVDAAVATAFALAVTHPDRGQHRRRRLPALCARPRATRSPTTSARWRPRGATPTMFLRDGRYDEELHHESHLAVGVPGTVAGLHMAWKEHGKLPWARLVEPAIALARDGFVVTDGLARSLQGDPPDMKKYPASVAAVLAGGISLRDGRRAASSPTSPAPSSASRASGPAGFYEGETARAHREGDEGAGGGLITAADLKAYQAKRRDAAARDLPRLRRALPCRRPAPAGSALLQMLNILEGYDLKAKGFGSAATVHLVAEAMRRAFADRARHLGDPEVNPEHADRAAHLEGVRGRAAQDDSPTTARRSPRRRLSSGRRRARRRRTSRWWTWSATRSR